MELISVWFISPKLMLEMNGQWEKRSLVLINQQQSNNERKMLDNVTMNVNWYDEQSISFDLRILAISFLCFLWKQTCFQSSTRWKYIWIRSQSIEQLDWQFHFIEINHFFLFFFLIVVKWFDSKVFCWIEIHQWKLSN